MEMRQTTKVTGFNKGKVVNEVVAVCETTKVTWF